MVAKKSLLVRFHHVYSLGIDPILAQHIAHLFIRDTLTVYEEKIYLDDTQDTDHFEVILYDFDNKKEIHICSSSRISIPQTGNRCDLSHPQ